MSEETKNNAAKVSENQTVTTQSGKKANIRWMFMTIAVIVIAAIVGTVVYTSSPSHRAGEKLKLAEKYLEDMDYEQAIANFQLALEIDSNNQKVIATIESHLEEFYQQARVYAGMGEYASEKELAVFMMSVNEDNILAKLADAEADCGTGEIEKARTQFEKLINSGSDNEEIDIVITDNLDKFYRQARQYGSQGEYASEKELAIFMIKADADNVRGKIADAEADCGIGEIEKARATYEEAVGGGVDEDDVAKGIQYCDAILQLLTYCENSKWEDVVTYLNAEAFSVISERLVAGKELVYSRNVDMLLGLTDNGVYVYSGELSEGSIGGRGTGIVSSVNTNAIYEGEWADHSPTGKGVLTIWNKNEDFSQANVYEGIFAGGLLNGSTIFKTWINDSQVEVTLEIGKGNVSVYQVDEKGNIWLTEDLSESECSYVVEYEKAERNVIVDYIAGLPGFGGSDRILSTNLIDLVPPVIKCSLSGGRWYDGKNPIGKGIIATDNVDGDLTARITNESRKTTDSPGYQDDNNYVLEVTYSVVDSAGNIAELRVTYYVMFEYCAENWSYLPSYLE